MIFRLICLLLLSKTCFAQEEKPFHFIGLTPHVNIGAQTFYVAYCGKCQEPGYVFEDERAWLFGIGANLNYYNGYFKIAGDFSVNDIRNHSQPLQYSLNTAFNVLMGTKGNYFLGPQIGYQYLAHPGIENSDYRSHSLVYGLDFLAKGISINFSWRRHLLNPEYYQISNSLNESSKRDSYWYLSLGYTFRLHTFGKAKN